MNEPDPKSPAGSEGPRDEAPEAGDGQLRCDFCGEPAPSVRRVALDGEYDRLRKRHKVLYACSGCSDRKEKERLGI